MLLIALISALATLIVDLDLPNSIYLMSFFVPPIVLNIWIYFNTIGQERITNVRRFLIYLSLFILVFVSEYQRFYDFVYLHENSDLTFQKIFLVTVSGLFVAGDRISKIIVDDYKTYRSENPN